MPVVTVQALPPDNPSQIDLTLTKVVSELTAALDTAPNNVWVNFIPMAALREGNKIPGRKEYHAIVTVLANPRPEEVVSQGLQAAARAVASGLGVKLENVWVYWVDLPRGRVFADGEVR